MLDFISQPMIGYFAIALLHVFSALYFAAVRWFHVCAPYKHKPEEYYPARKWLSLMCLFILVEIPYVLNPASDVGFLTACLVLSWGYPLSAVVVSYAYFRDRNVSKRNNPSLLTLCFLVLGAEVALALAALFCPDLCLHYYIYIVVVVSTVSFLIYAVLALFCLALYRKIQHEFRDTYSDESRYPATMGYSALLSMLLIFAFTSLPLLMHSRLLLAIVQVVLIIWHVVFLIYILDSHVKAETESDVSVVSVEETVDVPSDEAVEEKMEQDRDALLLGRIEELMQTKQPYLKSHFTAMDLAAELGTNRTYLTNAIKTRYESFYHLVNSYRLKYAEKYQLEHPDMKKEQLAIASGFGSYRSYVRALKSVK